jgi:2-keto-4-pentenoate hydratase
LHPETVADGYAVQDAVAALNGLRQRGWKIGATNAAARAVINIAEPVSGRLYAPFCHDSPAELSADAFGMRALEPEADVPPRREPYGEDDVAEAVAMAHPRSSPRQPAPRP